MAVGSRSKPSCNAAGEASLSTGPNAAPAPPQPDGYPDRPGHSRQDDYHPLLDSLKRGSRVLGAPILGKIGSIVRCPASVLHVAITFDDGPDPVSTVEIMRELDKSDTKATFFVLADRANAHPEVLTELVEHGHEIGVHGLNHDRLTTLGRREVGRRLREARDIVEGLTGQQMKLFRPPYGAQNVSTVRSVMRLGMEPVLWDVDPHDWEDQPLDSAVDAVVRSVASGSIVLLHDHVSIAQFTRTEFTRQLVDGLQSRGLTPTTVGRLLLDGPPHRAVWRVR